MLFPATSTGTDVVGRWPDLAYGRAADTIWTKDTGFRTICLDSQSVQGGGPAVTPPTSMHRIAARVPAHRAGSSPQYIF